MHIDSGQLLIAPPRGDIESLQVRLREIKAAGGTPRGVIIGPPVTWLAMMETWGEQGWWFKAVAFVASRDAGDLLVTSGSADFVALVSRDIEPAPPGAHPNPLTFLADDWKAPIGLMPIQYPMCLGPWTPRIQAWAEASPEIRIALSEPELVEVFTDSACIGPTINLQALVTNLDIARILASSNHIDLLARTLP